MNNRFYVYHWLREDGTPYYVGKGQTNRAFVKRRLYRPPLDRIKIVKNNLTEQQAFDLEIKLISKYGRKDLGTGILRNKTEGGDGHVPGPETRLKLSSSLKKYFETNEVWNKNKKVWYNNGITKHKPETIAKIKAARAKQVIGLTSEETKEKMRKTRFRLIKEDKIKKTPSPLCKKVEYEGVKYPSVAAMARSLNTSRRNIKSWLFKGVKRRNA